MAESNEECEPIIPGKITPKKLPKQGGGGGHEFVASLPEKGEEGIEYVLMDDISDCSTYKGTYVWNEGCSTFVETSGSGGGGTIERYTFEKTDEGWVAKRNNTVIFTYVDKDTVDEYEFEDTTDGFQVTKNGVVIFSHTDRGEGGGGGGDSKTYTITATDTGWEFKEDGEVKFIYTEPTNEPSDGTYFTSTTLSTTITGTTNVLASSVSGLVLNDVVVGETLIYDEAGTLGKVKAILGSALTVETITIAGTSGTDTDTQYDFENSLDDDGNIIGWQVKNHETGAVIYTYTDKDTDTDTDTDTTYDFENVVEDGKVVGWRVKNHTTGNVVYTYTDLDTDTVGGGHTILDTDGVAVPDEDNLQFIGLDVRDNATASTTEVESFGLNNDSMDDVVTGDIGPHFYGGEVYSTDEQVVGKWIDGRPIYQITVYNSGSFTVGSSSRLDTRIADLSSLNIEDVIEPVSGFSPNWAGTNQTIPVAVSAPSTDSVWADYIWVKSSKELHFRGQRSVGDTPVTGLYATLKYIKAS